jgi:hypothetical protein
LKSALHPERREGSFENLSRLASSMSKKSPAPDLSRRQFIGASCCAAVGATGLLSALGSLRLMGAVASPGNDRVRLQGARLPFPQRRQ